MAINSIVYVYRVIPNVWKICVSVLQGDNSGSVDIKAFFKRWDTIECHRKPLPYNKA